MWGVSMLKCNDCGIESEHPKGWYAELSKEGKLIRCPECGIKEKESRYQNRYGRNERAIRDAES